MLLARHCGPFLVLGVSLIACSGGDEVSADASTSVQLDAGGDAVDARASDAMSSDFALTSSAFADGTVIPTLHTCAGDNTSPTLAWEGPPTGTMSYAIVFTDISIDFLHSVTWDIPAEVNSIPADIEKAFEPADLPGAKQANSYLGTRGYAGPCPPNEHTYEFKIHALDVATLGGVDSQTSGAQARTAIEAVSIGSATLTGSFDPNNP